MTNMLYYRTAPPGGAPPPGWTVETDPTSGRSLHFGRKGHYYIGHNYTDATKPRVGHNYIGHNYIGHNYTDATNPRVGRCHNYMGATKPPVGR